VQLKLGFLPQPIGPKQYLTTHVLTHPCKPRRNLGKGKGCCGSAHCRLLMHISAHSSDLIPVCQTSVRYKMRSLTSCRIGRPRQTLFVGWPKGPLREAPVAISPRSRAINVRLHRPLPIDKFICIRLAKHYHVQTLLPTVALPVYLVSASKSQSAHEYSAQTRSLNRCQSAHTPPGKASPSAPSLSHTPSTEKPS